MTPNSGHGRARVKDILPEHVGADAVSEGFARPQMWIMRGEVLQDPVLVDDVNAGLTRTQLMSTDAVVQSPWLSGRPVLRLIRT